MAGQEDVIPHHGVCLWAAPFCTEACKATVSAPGSLLEDRLQLQRFNVFRKVVLSEMALLSFGFEGKSLLNFHKCNIRRNFSLLPSVLFFYYIHFLIFGWKIKLFKEYAFH